MALRVPLAQTAGSAQAGPQGQPPSCPQAYEELHSRGEMSTVTIMQTSRPWASHAWWPLCSPGHWTAVGMSQGRRVYPLHAAPTSRAPDAAPGASQSLSQGQGGRPHDVRRGQQCTGTVGFSQLSIPPHATTQAAEGPAWRPGETASPLLDVFGPLLLPVHRALRLRL